MSPSLLLESISAFSLVAGLVFAALQLRDTRRARLRTTRLELVRSFQSPEFVRGLAIIAELPDGMTAAQIEARLSGEERDLVLLVVANWESVGVLLHRGDLTLELVSDFFGGMLPLSWHRLGPLIARLRETSGNARIGEWFELAVQRLEAGTTRQLPAPLASLPREPRVARAAGKPAEAGTSGGGLRVPRIRTRHAAHLEPPHHENETSPGGRGSPAATSPSRGEP